KSNDKVKYSGIKNLVERLINSLSVKKRIELIPELLDFPILGNLSIIEQLEFINPFYFVNLEKDVFEKISKPKIKKERIDYFIKAVLSENTGERKWAALTLFKLLHMGFLNKGQINRLQVALWKRKDEYGLPAETDYFKFAFLSFPNSPKTKVDLLVKKFILENDFPVQKKKENSNISLTRGVIPLCQEIVGASKNIQFSEAEVNSILDKLVEWWNEDKKYLKIEEQPSPFGTIANEFKKRFAGLVDVLVAIAPHFGVRKTKEIFLKIDSLIEDMEKYNLSTSQIEFAYLNIFPEKKEVVLKKVEKGLASDIMEKVGDNLKAVRILFERTFTFLNSSYYERVLTLLAQMIRWRKRTGLPSVLIIFERIIKNHSNHYTKEIEQLILSGLDYISKETSYENDYFEFPEKLEIRYYTARLAYQVHEIYVSKEVAIPEEIEIWKGICLNEDEFAEIKNQWREKC
ncbi:MAG TPA: hypothetical protein PLD55_13450, partial [bacterium]|nr:hypothetical protein [bacterium]